MAEVYDANSHLITGGELRALQPIFKIYGRRQVFTGPIVTLKVFEDNVVLLLTAVVAVVVVKVHTIPHFFASSYAGLGLYVFLLILPFIVMCPLSIYRQKHRVNLLLLGVFTVAISFFVGLTCAFNSEVVVMSICHGYANGRHGQAAHVTVVDAFS
ncbi:putative 4-hydroxy-4-methyl-2-oxoglutarate aldolase 2 [Hordeum vulgare]|nr:putative 4-hydroxy-4-methyl-2-oxoglutarate aldolase 2 [Hordeum vulgare]